MSNWNRKEIESLKYCDRPKVRVILDGSTVVRSGTITIDENNPWVSLNNGAIADRFGWSLVLGVLNNPDEHPIAMSPD